MTAHTLLFASALGVFVCAACSPAPRPESEPPSSAGTVAEARPTLAPASLRESDGEIASGPASAATAEPPAVASVSAPPGATGAAPIDAPAPRAPSLLDPAQATAKAPATFIVRFETSAGTFDMKCTREWSPAGVDRFFNLVKMGFFEGVAFFRAITQPKPFVVQFGIHGDPAVSKRWVKSRLPAEPAKRSNTRGTLSYAMAGSPDTRTTQLFFNLRDNSSLDKMDFGPICEVTGKGMDEVVDKLFSGYGGKPSDEQDRIQKEGAAFLLSKFPKLDTIKRAQIVNRP